MMKKKTGFDYFNYVVMILVLIVTLLPFWIAVVGSFNEGLDYARGGVYLWVREFTTANYKAALMDKSIIKAFGITAARTFIGTATHIMFTLTVAYAMSRSELKFKGLYMGFFVVTMFFGGAIIPVYLLYRTLGLLNNFMVYIIPGLFSVWNMIIFISFIRGLPNSIIESARIDGASEYTILVRMVFPLSKAAIAAIALFTGVGHWNAYYDSMMFTTDTNLQTIQYFLMRIITKFNVAAGIGASASANIPDHAKKLSPETIKLAMMMITVGPIILLYPFLQKYFIKGVYIGSIKG